MSYSLGIDIGSTSVNTVVLDANSNVISEYYDFAYGKPFHVLEDRLNNLFTEFTQDNLKCICFTGTGGKKAAELLGGKVINEIIAHSTAVSELYPKTRTVIEMGGEDSKLIFLENGQVEGQTYLSDFAMNSLCAAGTGSFLDQQGKRIGVKIDKEFGELSLKSENPPRIAGRCSVFAKSDMIHLQQVATPVHDILAGLCFAVARNFKSTLGKGKTFKTPVLFQGGVASNVGMVRAFQEVLELKPEELIIPEHHASMGAIGAVLQQQRSPENCPPFRGLKDLQKFLTQKEEHSSNIKPLKHKGHTLNREIRDISSETVPVDVFLGVDVGSLSTNVVLIDKDINVIARRYLPTASKPLNAIKRGLKEINEELGDRVNVIGVGATGSGRYLTGDFIGADTIQNEITAQATATIAFNPEVDTIFEIGGQDSKYIHIENGVVVDFEMNKVCAAGTGSFLEEQAEKLNINIKKEFEALGFQGLNPSKLGERCTVFMESDLNSLLQKGSKKENLISGLAYSTVQNYINRVVRDKPVGSHVFFQGGVTNNMAVVAAFEEITGKRINIPPHFDVTGAIGAAILARDKMPHGKKTRFKGFDISKIQFTSDTFICKKCSNHCEIRRIKADGQKPLFYGGICDLYEVEERKGKGQDIPNLFEERISLLEQGYTPPVSKTKSTIGIPRALMIYYQQFPYWRTFFESLDFDVVLSDESNKTILNNGLEMMTAETCLPVELVHGHVLNLFEKKVDHVFLPFVVDNKPTDGTKTSNANCPWIQSHPFMIKAALKQNGNAPKLLVPTLHFRYENTFKKEITSFMKEAFGKSKRQVLQAIEKAGEAQSNFELAVYKRGKIVLGNLPKDKKCFVILGRPYNTGDSMQNLGLVEKLIGIDIIPIPVDYLPLKDEDITQTYPNMYWPNGRKIIAASRIIGRMKDLSAIYLGNFRCGPDTFIQHYVKKEIQNKPYLHLEIDEHSADAGMITRIEAFLDSIDGAYAKPRKPKNINDRVQTPYPDMEGRTLYFPYARDVIYAFAAACRSVGMKAEVLPMQNEESLELGRKYTSGQECFPMIATTGSFIQKLQEPGIDPKKVAFFMPDHNGPCRFGQYNRLQRIIFNKLGFHDVEILQPSNADSYASLAPGHSNAWRAATYKGIVAIDLLRKMQQQVRPYESIKGQTNKVYEKSLEAISECIAHGGKNLKTVMKDAALRFKAIPVKNGKRKPVVAIVGEIFMRDNPFCSANLVERLEKLGAETMMAPFAEWISYSTYRFKRDSKWKNDNKGIFKSRLQAIFQHYVETQLARSVNSVFPMEEEIAVKDMLEHSNKYIHQDYDGDPPMALGTASILSKKYISGIVNILPFTCMPGTLNSAVSDSFRVDNDGLPWENFAYDGQDDTAFDTRFQAFMHQVEEYAKRKEFDALPIRAALS
jgi:predicted CoA-substrate-specific enzyme activase